jgi:hypothetical protein
MIYSRGKIQIIEKNRDENVLKDKSPENQNHNYTIDKVGLNRTCENKTR